MDTKTYRMNLVNHINNSVDKISGLCIATSDAALTADVKTARENVDTLRDTIRESYATINDAAEIALRGGIPQVVVEAYLKRFDDFVDDAISIILRVGIIINAALNS